MERSYYQEYFFFEQDNWWFVSRRRILLALLRRALPAKSGLQILDAGCGTGINLEYLAEFGNVTGVDFADEAIAFCQRRGNDSVRKADLTDLDGWPDAEWDLVTALDVIEHIDDDRSVVRELVRVTKPGGHLLVTVPAFPALWSEHDEVNHHKRRYRARELRTLLEENGCEVVRFTYMNTVLFPMAWLVRTWQQIRRRFQAPAEHAPKTDFVDYHPVVNSLLQFTFTAEAPFVTTTGLPFGLSLVCLVRKRADSGRERTA
ncbi:MAG: methyltransferase [Gemmatimonadota bacterium]|nr:MAG: methyltransferase [Gemmatimonadota bacterium]